MKKLLLILLLLVNPAFADGLIVPSNVPAGILITNGALKGNGSGAVSQAACSDLSNGTANCSAAVGQLPGVTSATAATAGNIGEYISSSVASGSAVSLTNGVAANLTSISLTAGEWDVSCSASFVTGATTQMFYQNVSVGTTSATQNTAPGASASFAISASGTTVNTTVPSVLNTMPNRYSLASTTTVYCVALASFITSTEAVYGLIRATRVH